MSPDSLEDRSPLVLSGRQLELIRALDDRAERLGAMYRGGLIVLADATNPERFVHCAHSMRELMEKLPEIVDVPTQARKERLNDKVREVQQAYGKARKASCCSIDQGTWRGEIDGPLRAFLEGLHAFLHWFSNHHRTRRSEAEVLFHALNPADGDLPGPLASHSAKAWDEKWDYFVSVSHHRKFAREPEFSEWLGKLESFLLDRLRPATFESFDAIDKLLVGGVTNAEP